MNTPAGAHITAASLCRPANLQANGRLGSSTSLPMGIHVDALEDFLNIWLPLPAQACSASFYGRGVWASQCHGSLISDAKRL